MSSTSTDKLYTVSLLEALDDPQVISKFQDILKPVVCQLLNEMIDNKLQEFQNTVTVDVAPLRAKTKTLDNRVCALEQRMEANEQYSRNLNLVIHGLNGASYSSVASSSNVASCR